MNRLTSIFRLFICSVIMLSVLSSCNQFKKKLEGKWVTTSEETTHYEFTFHPDDQMDILIRLEEQRENNGKDFRINYDITAKATYDASAKEIVYNVDPQTIKIQLSGIKLNETDLTGEDLQKALDQEKGLVLNDTASMQQLEASAKASLSTKDAKFTNITLLNNSLQLTSGTEQIDLTRK